MSDYHATDAIAQPSLDHAFLNEDGRAWSISSSLWLSSKAGEGCIVCANRSHSCVLLNPEFAGAPILKDFIFS